MFPGDYTIDGQYVHSITDDQDIAVGGSPTDYKEEDYLFDSTAETALAASDFVIISTRLESTSIGTGGNLSMAFDTQGDGGSGALATSGATSANNCVWITSQGNNLVLPSSLFSAQSTRTGRIRMIYDVGTVASPIASTVLFTFCSLNDDSTNAFDPGEFTVDGGYIFTSSGTANTTTNWDLDATGDGYASAADFAVVMTEFIAGSSGATNAPYIRFTVSSDSGSSTIVTTAGTSAPAEATFAVFPGQPVVVPASLFDSGQSTRNGVMRAGSASQNLIFNFCSWNT